LSGLQIIIAVVALGSCFRGAGHPFYWMALVFFLPLARFLVSETYRRHTRAWLRLLWHSLESYPGRDRQIPWLATACFVVVPAGLLFLSNNRNPSYGDTWPVMPTAFSLVTEGSWDLSRYVETAPDAYRGPEGEQLPYSTLRRGDGVYSTYPAGMLQFAFPVALLARLTGADLTTSKTQSHLEKWTAAWLSAFCLGLFFLLALHLAPARPAWLAACFLATGSVMFSTCGQNLWQHGGVIFWSLLVLLVEFRRPSAAATLLQGIACGMMLACRLTATLFLLPFGAWVFFRSPRRALAIALVAGLAYAPWAWAYFSIYGNPFGPSTALMAGGYWSTDWVGTLGDVLIGPSRGLLVYQPWLILGVIAFFPLLRSGLAFRVPRACPAGGQLFCLVVLCFHVALITSWRYWWGGHCWGSRLFAEAIPLAALLCVRPLAILWQWPTGRRLLIPLLLLSFWMHAAATCGRGDYWNNWSDIDHHPERLRSWSHPPFLYPFQHSYSLAR
jgi:hypothetical protein